MTLKTKARIYKIFGIFLAYKEENEYLQSPEFWKAHAKIVNKKENDMSPVNAQSLLIGIWQAKHGFYRSYSPLQSFIRRLKWRIKSWQTKKN